MARIRIRPIPGGYVGSISIASDPVDIGALGDVGSDTIVTVGAVGESKAEAVHKAAMMAERIIDDPIMQAILPPQAKAAIIATKKIASAAGKGGRALKSLWGRIRGKGKKKRSQQRLARSLVTDKRAAGARKPFSPSRRPPPPMAPPPSEPTDDEEYEDEMYDEQYDPAYDDNESYDIDNDEGDENLPEDQFDPEEPDPHSEPMPTGPQPYSDVTPGEPMSEDAQASEES